jgi:hypothetical protein
MSHYSATQLPPLPPAQKLGQRGHSFTNLSQQRARMIAQYFNELATVEGVFDIPAFQAFFVPDPNADELASLQSFDGGVISDR